MPPALRWRITLTVALLFVVSMLFKLICFLLNEPFTIAFYGGIALAIITALWVPSILLRIWKKRGETA